VGEQIDLVNLSPEFDMKRLAYAALIAGVAMSSTVSAQQQTRPPASPTFGASAGGGAGIAIPVGRLSETNTAGYTFMGLVDFSAADQPYSFRGEVIYQHYDRKRNVTGTESKNVLSFGAALLARSNVGASSGYVIGGIGVYRPTDEGTKPGVSAGVGLEVPLTFFIGMAEIRAHWVMTEGRPVVTLPITLGARF
jgi:hypothetical protein